MEFRSDASHGYRLTMNRQHRRKRTSRRTHARSRRTFDLGGFGLRVLVLSPLAIPAILGASGGPPAYASNVPITVSGFGWGHGRGAGQFGQAGEAILGNQTYQSILSYYYQGTTLGTASDQLVSVELQGNAFQNIEVYSPVPFSVSGTSLPANTMAELSWTGSDWNALVSSGATGGCSSSPTWTPVASGLSSAQAIIAPGAGLSLTAMESETFNDSLVVCYANGTTEHVAGYVQGATYIDGNLPVQRTVNVLPIQNYLEGVVPHETPASWGSLGGPGPQGEAWGFQALEAQAVEARSYVLSSPNGWYGFADTCDSTSCQVYDGMTDPSSPYASLDALATQAVLDTANQVLVQGNGAIARTEYSSSTGGYTAGGAFPAVVDPYDSICIPGVCNANHTWTTTISSSQIESAYPQIGTLTALTVESRNGLGTIGGRVLTLDVVGSSGSVTVTGSEFAAALGLNSDWFEFSGPIPITNDTLQAVQAPGYWIEGASGTVNAFGSAQSFGSMAGKATDGPIVGMASTPDGQGYWLVTANGAVYNFGDAGNFGSAANLHLNQPIVGMASTPNGQGYWLVAADGGIFSFGNASFFGSTGAMRLNQPIVGMASTADGQGYWLVAADGGIFTFGDAKFYGSTGNLRLNKPVVGMVPTGSGQGYWLVAADGGIFTFGDATFVGSLPGEGITGTAVSVAPSPDGRGYYVVLSTGRVVPFGDATFLGDVTTLSPPFTGSVVAIAADR